MAQNTSSTSAHEFVLDDFLAPPLTKKGEFRLHATMMFLTYPKCNLEKQLIIDGLVVKGIKFDFYTIARELHQDGTPHLHVLLKNHAVKFDVTSEKHFNVSGFHPNIRKVKPGPGHVERVIGYLKKYDTECMTNMPPRECYGSKEGVYRESIAAGKAGSRKRAREVIMDGDPEGYYKCQTNIERTLEGFSEKVTPWYPKSWYDPYIYPPEVLEWMKQLVPDPRRERFKLLLVLGTSNIGKTKMMRSIRPHHLYLGGFPMLKKFQCTGYEYIIWDDIHWSRSSGTNHVDPEEWRFLLLGMNDGGTVRHSFSKFEENMVCVPSIVLMNPEKGGWFWQYCHEVEEWRRECIFLDLRKNPPALYAPIQSTF